jgi:hypothetical protein
LSFFQAALAEERRERERVQEAWEEERLETQKERERARAEAALALEREQERDRERERDRELKVSRIWLRFSESLKCEERGREQEQAHILTKKKSLCWDYLE